MYLLVEAFCTSVDDNRVMALQPVLRKLCSLMALYQMEKEMADFIESGAIQPALCPVVRRRVRGPPCLSVDPKILKM